MQELTVRTWVDEETGIKGKAKFSDDLSYRYSLVREWGTNPPMVFIMLNPSTADEQFLDPTVTRCVGFAQRENAGSLIVLNLFALRSTDPMALYQHSRPVGPHNNAEFTTIPKNARIVVAWGNHADARRGRVKEVLALVGSRELLCLGTTKNGQPKHPLYIKKDTALVQWNFK
jgi:hypothetical protein